MKKENTAVVIHACGFTSKNSICSVFISRIGKAADLINGIQDRNECTS